MAALIDSARSVAIAATSLPSHIVITTGRGKCARHNAGRLWPVTMPSRADSAWNSIAIMFDRSTTHSSM